ncbi:class I SAM-dependent methyltransferase [Bermanella marisrubri]|uniref:Predicted O-methyltransferase n=1 Tax=Bermanella marisrubri TaxID=207949 RepID=Q1MYV8_9GAMM|nr:class I SAM-dependent methyltransferase [Bermanella marisrubri]EAT11183.1 Predicted O-methyltransferase [Oceanobacter sp. RED65] [Bermanella marisrubri]QIZ83368.1 class I SAM-dependent methyltransferase [Bermanella marisrubri]
MNARKIAIALLSITLIACSESDVSFETIMSSDHRTSDQVRDQYRKPNVTLEFFDVQPNHTVVEIWPGGGWYTRILAPYLKDKGQLYAAHFDKDSSVEFFKRSRRSFEQDLQELADVYGNVTVTTFHPPEQVDIAPAGSADRVLTFRNVHNWYMRGGGDEKVLAAFKAFYKTLKPGGLLGVVDHRLPEDMPAEAMNASGYMHQSYVIAMAERAGFKLLEASELNANPADTADHPKGVWTLPPNLRLGEEDKEKYQSIGESDRMTLKFVKPE